MLCPRRRVQKKGHHFVELDSIASDAVLMIGMPHAAFPAVNLKSVSRIALSLFTLMCAAFRPVQASERSWASPMDDYERTLRALNQYRVLAAEDDGAVLPATEEPVEPGEYYAGVPRLIELLSRIGDLPAESVPVDSELYEGELVTAVKRFQCRHGLEPNGRIDAMTLEQLNTPLNVRVRQLELALERWRRRPYDPSRPAIVLNVPEFRLRAFGGANAGGRDPELEMKVVVGQAPEHKTPILISQLQTVIFRPSWTVPASIQRNELLQEIRRDRSWISANNFELVTQQGEVAEDETVSEHVFSELEKGELQLRQKPGPKNTLGLVKFLFICTTRLHGGYLRRSAAISATAAFAWKGHKTWRSGSYVSSPVGRGSASLQLCKGRNRSP